MSDPVNVRGSECFTEILLIIRLGLTKLIANPMPLEATQSPLIPTVSNDSMANDRTCEKCVILASSVLSS